MEQDKITELLGVSAGATPLSNNGSFHKKKSLSQQSSFSTSGEYYSDSSSGDVNSRSLYRKMSSGEIPPAIEPRSEWARRVQCIINCARQMNSMKPGASLSASSSSPHLLTDIHSSFLRTEDCVGRGDQFQQFGCFEVWGPPC